MVSLSYQKLIHINIMKKDFSFYEFVGIIVPSVTFLFFFELLHEITSGKALVNFLTVGGTAVFIIIAYGIGQIIQVFGGMYEVVIWKIIRGMPTAWLTKKPRFGLKLFDEPYEAGVRDKLYQRFGKADGKDYGKDAYNVLATKQQTARIDVFNANYSLFRGLAVVFLFLSVYSGQQIGWEYSTLPILLFFIASLRMVRFGRHYAEEVYRTFLNTV